MSKPELTIYEKHPHADAYRVGGFFSPYCLVSTDKRFTDAELAAEYYRASFLHEYSLSEHDGYDGAPETRTHRIQARTFQRFASFPHYDE
jgi:hypothetical protein